MSEVSSKNGWRSYRFDEMAVMVNDRIDNPSEADVEYYVGLEHLDSDSLTIRRWGSPSDVEATKLRFRTGDIIFGRRRAYQRKLAVADFDGICSAHAMVLRPKSGVVLPEFLPFFMQSDLFMERAKEISVGSLSPTINWKTLTNEEFLLPPIDEQRRIAIVLQAFDRLANTLYALRRSHEQAISSSLGSLIGQHTADSVMIGAVSLRVTNGFVGSAVKHYVPAGVPYLRSLNVRRSGISFDDLVHISESFHEATLKSQLREGDLLTVQSGHVGETAVVPAKCENWNCHALILTRLDQTRALPKYVATFLNSLLGQRKLARLYVGTTVAHLNTSDLASLEIPLPDIEHQERIVKFAEAVGGSTIRLFDREKECDILRRQVLSQTLGIKVAR